MSRVSLLVTLHIIIAFMLGIYAYSMASIASAEPAYVEDGDAILNVSDPSDRSSDAVPGGYTSPNGNTTVGNKSNTTVGNKGGGSSSLINPVEVGSIQEFLVKIIEVIVIFATPIIVLFIMYAGYLFVTAAGNTEQISTARTALLWSIVGGVIVLGAELIIKVIDGTIKAF